MEGLENEGGLAIIGASCPMKGGFKPSTHHDIKELKVGTLGTWLERGPGGGGGGGISHPSSYHEFNLAS